VAPAHQRLDAEDAPAAQIHLAANREKALELARFLRMNPEILGSFTRP
jgi:hypothetical protein